MSRDSVEERIRMVIRVAVPGAITSQPNWDNLVMLLSRAFIEMDDEETVNENWMLLALGVALGIVLSVAATFAWLGIHGPFCST